MFCHIVFVADYFAVCSLLYLFFFFKQKTAYEMRISDWSSACALPISVRPPPQEPRRAGRRPDGHDPHRAFSSMMSSGSVAGTARAGKRRRTIHDIATSLAPWSRHGRSEEHTSELQSLMRISYAVFCLKKKTIQRSWRDTHTTDANNED